jgi:hypothetical protein
MVRHPSDHDGWCAGGFLEKAKFNRDFPLEKKAVIDETTSHSTKPPKDGGKWLVIPRRRESSSLKIACEVGQLWFFVRHAGCFSCWIPAYAGMTVLMENLGSMLTN